MPKSTPYAFILPDECLQHQTCPKCKKYLSCGPVKTYHFHDGAYEIRCGRCVKDGDGGVVSTLNKLFENAWFPCVNRLEGCNSVVAYKEMKAHEEICKGTTIACPICAAQEEYSLMALINHFKSRHWKNFLVKPLFNITENTPGHLLHYDITKNILVLITVEFNKDKALIIKILSSLKIGLRQKITIYNSSSSQPDDSTEMYRSNFFSCKGFGDTSEGLSIPTALIEQCPQLLCRMEFDLVGLKVQHIYLPALGAVSNKAFADESGLVKTSGSCEERRRELPDNIPRVRRDEVFETFSQKYVLSDDHTEITTVDYKDRRPLICSVCQIFLIVVQCSYFYRVWNGNIYNTICGRCCRSDILINTGDSKGQLNWNNIKTVDNALWQYYKLNFYCKFNCGEYFGGEKLVKHQDICVLNKNKGLTGEEKIARYFGVTMDKNCDKLGQHNSILIYREYLSYQGKIYVVTKEDIAFIVYYTFEKNALVFKVVHEYDNVNVSIKYYWSGGSTCLTREKGFNKFVFPQGIRQKVIIVVILQKKSEIDLMVI